GAERHGALEQRVRGADDRADVARVGDAVQVDAGRLRHGRPAPLPDRDRARARAKRGDRGEQLGVHLVALEPGIRGYEDQARHRARRQAGVEQVLALAREQALALAVLALAQLANQLQLLVMWAFNHFGVSYRVSDFGSGDSSPGTKKGGPKTLGPP